MEDKDETREHLLSENQNLRKELAELKAAETELRWIEAALRESEERYRRLLESITDYIYTVKVENGRPASTTHGPGCLAVTGYTSEYLQMYPHLWYEMIYEEERKSVLKQAERILSGEVVTPIEHRIIHKDGSIRWVRNTPVPHFDKEGELIAYDGIIEDITERRMAEEALRASREYARSIIESSMDMIIAVDKDRKISEFNRAAQETFGYVLEEVLGKHVDMLYADPSEGLKVHDVTLENGRHLQEIVNRRKNGKLFPSLLSSSVLQNAQGDIIGVMGVSHDITRRKRDEEALKESFANIERAKKEWEATFDGITDPLFIHDREFKVVRANRAYQQIAGMSFNEFIGRPYYEVFPKMDGPFKMCLKGLELQEEEEEVSCPVTNRIFKVRLYPINENGGLLYSIHILEDITEAKRAEERIKEEIEVTSHLLMISEATAHTTDIDKLMEQVVHCGHEIVKCDLYLSYLWDTETKSFRPSQAVGLPHNLIPLFKTESLDMKVGFVKEAIRKKEPVIEKVSGQWPVVRGQQNLTTEHRPPNTVFSWLSDIHTLTVIPLIGKKGPLGLIVGIYLKTTPHLHPLPMRGEEIKGGHPLHEGEGAFTEQDIKVMKGIMHQVSIALEEARLFKESVDRAMELSHRIEMIQAMHEIDRSILSTLEAQEILETVVRLVSKVISSDRVTVSLVDRGKGGFTYAAGFGTAVVPKGAFTLFADTSASGVIETGRTECVNNLLEMTPLLPIEKKLLDEGFLSHIRVPITIKGDVAGILTVGANRPSVFTREDLSILEKLASQIGVALSNARLISDLEELFLGTVKSLSSAIDAKSPWTAGHSERVTKYALDIAKEMGLGKEDMKALEVAGLLHDIGKIGTYDILLDKPGRLEPEEIEIVRLHPGKGAEILEPISKFGNIIPAIRHHHEFYNGTGYPDKLKGEDIPLLARILAVADTFDAMAADRPYRKGRPMDYIISEFKRCSCTQFDPKVVEAFLTLVSSEKEDFKMAAN